MTRMILGSGLAAANHRLRRQRAEGDGHQGPAPREEPGAPSRVSQTKAEGGGESRGEGPQRVRGRGRRGVGRRNWVLSGLVAVHVRVLEGQHGRGRAGAAWALGRTRAGRQGEAGAGKATAATGCSRPGLSAGTQDRTGCAAADVRESRKQLSARPGPLPGGRGPAAAAAARGSGRRRACARPGAAPSAGAPAAPAPPPGPTPGPPSEGPRHASGAGAQHAPGRDPRGPGTRPARRPGPRAGHTCSHACGATTPPGPSAVPEVPLLASSPLQRSPDLPQAGRIADLLIRFSHRIENSCSETGQGRRREA